MVSYLFSLVLISNSIVLILLVVEDGLVPLRQVSMGAAAIVLILVVVEDGLVPYSESKRSTNNKWS